MLNLLPPEEKEMVGRERRRRFAVVFGILLAVFLAIGAALTIPSYVALVFRRLDLTRERDLSRRAPLLGAVGEIEKNIRDFNKKLLLYEKNKKEIRPVAGVAEQVLKLRPAGLSVRNLLYERASKTNSERLTVKGRAQSRSELLRFQKSLEASDLFQKVESPISNLLQEVDVEFSLILEMKTP